MAYFSLTIMKFPIEFAALDFRTAQVAKLVDALGSGPSGGNTVEVRVLSWAPEKNKTHCSSSAFFFVHSFRPVARFPLPASHLTVFAASASNSCFACIWAATDEMKNGEGQAFRPPPLSQSARRFQKPAPQPHRSRAVPYRASPANSLAGSEDFPPAGVLLISCVSQLMATSSTTR